MDYHQSQLAKPFIIGISGRSGSGKTFFLKYFRENFSIEEVCLISQDDYYFQVAQNMTPEENNLYNFDVPETIDRSMLYADITKLINRETIYKKVYAFNDPSKTPKILEIRPAPIIIIEGLFIFHFTEIAQLLDLKIFIEADEDVALARRLKRDLEERGYSDDAVLCKWKNHVEPAYKEFLLPYKNGCEQVIVNNTPITDDIIRANNKLSKELREKVL